MTAQDVKDFVARSLAEALKRMDVDPASVPDDFDLFERGIIDSLGLIEIITEIEERFDLDLDFELLDPEQLTVIGALARHVEAQSGRPAG